MKNDILVLDIKAKEMWDEVNEEFVYAPSQKIVLKHSLLSISDWESKWRKPFLSNKEKTVDELRDYVRCMTINRDVDDEIYKLLSYENLKQVKEYIDNPMTATTIKNRHGRRGRGGEDVTSELVYCWMVEYGIPFECEKWNFNRLIMLIRVCDIKNTPGKKMSQRDIMSQNHALNQMRRSKFKSRG